MAPTQDAALRLSAFKGRAGSTASFIGGLGWAARTAVEEEGDDAHQQRASSTSSVPVPHQLCAFITMRPVCGWRGRRRKEGEGEGERGGGGETYPRCWSEPSR